MWKTYIYAIVILKDQALRMQCCPTVRLVYYCFSGKARTGSYKSSEKSAGGHPIFSGPTAYGQAEGV